MTQGDPLSPKIFNVMVNGVLRHWVRGVVEGAEARGETGREGRHKERQDGRGGIRWHCFMPTTEW